MKVLKFILIFLHYASGSKFDSAIQELILNFQDPSVDIQFHVDLKSNFDLNILLESVNQNFNPTIVTTTRMGQVKSERNQLVIIVIDDLIHYEKIPMDVNDFYLIVTKTVDEKLAETFFNHTWESNKIININLMAQNIEQDINLITFFPFTHDGCSKASNIKIINKFTKNTTWELSEFFPIKLKNFHQCALKLGIQPSAPAAERVKNDNIVYGYVGSDIEIANGLANFFNFTNDFVFNDWWGKVFENGTGNYNLGKLIMREIDYVCGWHFLNLYKAKYLDYTQPYFYVPFVIVIPPAQPYTSLENLIRCFTPSLWTAFISSCILFFLLFYIINYFIERDAIIHYEMLLIIIVGEGTGEFPTKSSFRLIIMTFIIFCFIVRTAYVSEMFNFLQSGSSDKAITSLHDMEMRKFTLYAPSFIEDYISLAEIKYDKDYIKILNGLDDEILISQIFDPFFKGAFLEPLDIVIRGNNKYPFNILLEFFRAPVVVYFQKKSYLRNLFNEKIQQMIEGGLIELWINQRWKFKSVGGQVDGGSEPKVLSLNQLSAAFMICIGGLFLSLNVFLLEIFYHRFRT